MLQKRSLWSVSNVSWRSSGNRARGGAGLAAGTGCSGDTLLPRYSVALDTASARQAGATPTSRERSSADSISPLLLAPGSGALSPVALILFFERRLSSQPA